MRPSFAHLYVENRCNLRCEHCYECEESHPPHPESPLRAEDYERIFEELKALGVMVVTFSGGEPFLRRDLLDLVALARKKRFAVRIYTSGTLIDERKANRIAELRVSEVHVSVYSHDPAVHDRFTGIPGSHERSLRALRLLRERGVTTVLKSNIMTFNVDHLGELVALARAVGARCELDPTLHPRMNGDERPLAYQVQPAELARKFFARPDLVEAYRKDPDGLCLGEGSRGHDSPNCAAAFRIISIGADGGVHPCALYPTSAGSVREHSLAELWFRSQLMHELRETRFGKMEECPSCELKAACDPCMAYAEIEQGASSRCNSSSYNVARGLLRFAEHRRRANEKMSRGRRLTVLEASVDETTERPDHVRPTARL